MICCLDVDYQATGVTAAGVGFAAWDDPVARVEVVVRSFEPAADYQPGAFYLRELPFLVEVIARMPPIEVVIVDGYVWLGPAHPGLGKYLHDVRGGGIVIGVAKTRYLRAAAVEVVRGGSERPLFVTAAGIDPEAAATYVRTMHGEHRIPTMLRRVDGLARGHQVR